MIACDTFRPILFSTESLLCGVGAAQAGEQDHRSDGQRQHDATVPR